MRNRRRLFASKLAIQVSTEGTMRGSIWKNQQPPTVFLHDTKNHKYWTAVSHYAHYRSFRNVMSAANGDDKLSGSIMRILK